jgi:hypothetical protein
MTTIAAQGLSLIAGRSSCHAVREIAGLTNITFCNVVQQHSPNFLKSGIP